MDLMKIYYAIGGFSSNQGESEKAYEYIVKYVLRCDKSDYNYRAAGDYIHLKLSKMELKNEFNPLFAQVFMKYFSARGFLAFSKYVCDDYIYGDEEYKDYLCDIYNSFESIIKNFPNMVVNGNEERSLLTPEFLIDHCHFYSYKNVDEGNEKLAELIGKYSYTQERFEKIQDIQKQKNNVSPFNRDKRSRGWNVGKY